MTQDELESLARTIIGGGESYYAEFKSCWAFGPDGREPREIREVAKDIGEAVVAFANSDGGDLLVGVEDSGTVTGLPWSGEKLLYLEQAPHQQVKDADLGVQVLRAEVDGKTILIFRAPEHAGESVVTAAGRCLWRKGAASEPIPPEEIRRRRQHRLGDAAYEGQPVSSATVEDLDIPWEEVRRRRPHLERFAASNDVAGLLRYWNLVEGRNGHVILRRAALLLFAKDALRWHPNNRLRLRRVPGGAEGFGSRIGTREQDLAGPAARLVRTAIRALHSGLEVDTRQETLFETDRVLPSDAVDECVVNAIVHRNYAIEGNAIEVVLFPDRVEFKSPGRLPEPLTIEDLRARRGVHRSRNPLMMRVFRDLGWARDQGEGMRRIFGAMMQVELHEPEIEEVADTFIVRLSTRSLYDEQTRSWIAAFGPFGLQPEERKYLVALRREGKQLSVDKLARALDESYDATKQRLDALEQKGFVWHAHKSRSYHLVEPLAVSQERALKLFRGSSIVIDPATLLTREALQKVAQIEDERTLSTWIDRLKESGILAPAGRGQFHLGKSLLEYARVRI